MSTGFHHPPTPTRRTLARAATLRGITLFTGVEAAISIEPAPAGHALVFVRTDHADHRPIPALVSHVVPESRRTVLSSDPRSRDAATVQTVEHLMSALAGLGITDALIRVTGPEVPLGDGSAAAFVQALLDAGLRELPGPVPAPIIVTRPLRIGGGPDGAAPLIEAFPHPPHAPPGLSLEYRLEYPAQPIPWAVNLAQSATLELPHTGAPNTYTRDIAPARTFSLAPEAQALRAAGLFGHLSPDHMLVIGEHGPVQNAYRLPNELARHKLLDLLGDLALVGRPIQGRIVASRSGHAQNHEMARLLTEPDPS